MTPEVIAATAAVALGSSLGLWHLRAAEGDIRRPPWPIGVVHGLLGLAALGLLLVLSSGSAGRGVAGFRPAATALFALAALLGGMMMLTRGKRRGLIMAAHASVAVTGYVILLAWNAMT